MNRFFFFLWYCGTSLKLTWTEVKYGSSHVNNDWNRLYDRRKAVWSGPFNSVCNVDRSVLGFEEYAKYMAPWAGCIMLIDQPRISKNMLCEIDYSCH